MVSVASAVAFLGLFMSLSAVEFYSPLHKLGSLGASSTTTVQAVQALLTVAAMGALLTAVASIYHQLYHAAAGTKVAAGIIWAAAGVIEFFSFVEPAVQFDGAARARELSMAAAHVLPAAATITFFVSLALVFLHIRAGGGAVAGEGHLQILVKIVLGAAAILVGLMALAV